MPERMSMRRIKECLRLHFEAGLNQQAISRSLQIARSTVQDHLSARSTAARPGRNLKIYPTSSLKPCYFPSPSSRAANDRILSGSSP